jgi:integrase
MLTALQVKNAKPNNGKRARLGDGNNLWLFVDKNGNKSWVFRFKSPTTDTEREMGIGPERDVTLVQARQAAQEARKLLLAGQDPLEVRRAKQQADKIDAERPITFRDYAEQFVSGRESAWKNPVHRQQWRNSLRDHVFPIVGDMAIADIDTDSVLNVLRPIWNEKPETARRVRGRIESILSGAKVEGLRSGENPATWRNHLDQLLAARKKSDVQHHSALPHAELPKFWRSLATDTSNAAQMLRFIILTAARYSEAANMVPSEIVGDLWTVPKKRMKAGVAHAVPLTAAALACVPLVRVSDVALANCIRRHTTAPATTHGFRSTFRDWCGDATDYPREIAEAALAHQVGSDVERAYRRGAAVEKRRALMTSWADYCSSASSR